MTEGGRSAFKHKSTKVAAPAGRLALDSIANRDDDAFEGVLGLASKDTRRFFRENEIDETTDLVELCWGS
jgi:hypothetical protein